MSAEEKKAGIRDIMAAFIDEIHPDDIMSYADLEWSDGSVYRTLGFEAESLRDPVDFTIDPHTWLRTPISSTRAQGMVEKIPADTVLYYRNMGSLKYRLKLTDY